MSIPRLIVGGLLIVGGVAFSTLPRAEGPSEGATENATAASEATPQADSPSSKVAAPSVTAAQTPTEPGAPRACIVDQSALEDLQRSRTRLDEREQQLASKTRDIEGRERAIADELKRLEALRGEIESLRALHKADGDAKVARLVEMIETMSPKASAKVLAKVDESVALAAMGRMDTARLAKVMNLMEPDKSSRLSELLVGVVRTQSREPAQSGAAETTKKKGGE